jgi:gliding motility-associated-like protein
MYTIHTYNLSHLLKKLPKKFILLGFFAVFMYQNIYADHVEGGGIDMRALSNTPGKYRITLRMFSDMTDFPIYEYDKALNFTIFRKKDNFLMYQTDSRVYLSKIVPVVYTNEACATSRKLKTSVIYYQHDVDLDPDKYSDPQGYYVEVNNCCRSQSTDNTTDGALRKIQYGMAYTLEFPPLKRNGKLFLNSSPAFEDINGEFVCIYEPYKLSFNAKDVDGDQLKYSLINPTSGTAWQEAVYGTDEGYPKYVQLPLVAGLSGAYPMPGNPGLAINPTKGLLTVTATQLGAYTFTVLCEEFRNIDGQLVKIGQVMRDYQLLVIDCPNLKPAEPVIVATNYTGSSISICAGKEVELKVANDPTLDYQWQKDDDNIIGADQATYKTKEQGVYTVKISLKATCSRTNSSQPFTIVITGSSTKINAQPLTPCIGGNTTITAISGNNLSYQWYKDNVLLSAEILNKIKVNQAGKYHAIVTNAIENCISKSDTLTIKFELYGRTKLAKTENTAICPTKSITFSAENNTNYSYQWYKDDVELSGITNPTLPVNDIGKYYVSIVDNVTNCIIKSDTLEVTFRPLPTVNITPARNATEICDGDSLKLEATTGNYKYQWYKNDVKIVGSTKANYNAKQAGKYKVLITDSNDCENTSTDYPITVAVTIPIVLDTILAVCEGETQTVTLNGYPGGGSYTGKGVTGDVFSPKLAGAGKHEIVYEIKSAFECQNGKVKRLAVVAAKPRIKLDSVITTWRGSIINLKGTAGQDMTYDWSPTTYFIDSPNVPTPKVKIEDNIIYDLLVTNSAGCTATAKIKIRVFDKIWTPNIFTPNDDAQNDIWELSGSEKYPDVEVSIYNRWGEVVFYSKGYSTPFDGTYKGEPLPTGSYAYRVVAPSANYILTGGLEIMR